MPTISDLPSGTPSTSDILPFVQSVSTKKATFASLPVSTPTIAALATKQDTLVSASNIKTINWVSLLGSDNIIIGDGVVDWTSTRTEALKSATTDVNVSSATAPTAGQVLTATSSTAATWQIPKPTIVTYTGDWTTVSRLIDLWMNPKQLMLISTVTTWNLWFNLVQNWATQYWVWMGNTTQISLNQPTRIQWLCDSWWVLSVSWTYLKLWTTASEELNVNGRVFMISLF